MAPRCGLCLALVCIIAFSCVHGADAFWGLGNKKDVSVSGSTDDASKSAPASSPPDAHDLHHSEDLHGEWHDDAEDHEHDFDDEHHDHYWYNDVTKESQWEYPTYEFKDEEGRLYYVDPVTKETSYEKPIALDWKTNFDEDKKIFYTNVRTGESTYTAPAMMAWQRYELEDHSEL